MTIEGMAVSRITACRLDMRKNMKRNLVYIVLYMSLFSSVTLALV